MDGPCTPRKDREANKAKVNQAADSENDAL